MARLASSMAARMRRSGPCVRSPPAGPPTLLPRLLPLLPSPRLAPLLPPFLTTARCDPFRERVNVRQHESCGGAVAATLHRWIDAQGGGEDGSAPSLGGAVWPGANTASESTYLLPIPTPTPHPAPTPMPQPPPMPRPPTPIGEPAECARWVLRQAPTCCETIGFSARRRLRVSRTRTAKAPTHTEATTDADTCTHPCEPSANRPWGGNLCAPACVSGVREASSGGHLRGRITARCWACVAQPLH